MQHPQANPCPQGAQKPSALCIQMELAQVEIAEQNGLALIA
jgi:hypothetical protein